MILPVTVRGRLVCKGDGMTDLQTLLPTPPQMSARPAAADATAAPPSREPPAIIPNFRFVPSVPMGDATGALDAAYVAQTYATAALRAPPVAPAQPAPNDRPVAKTPASDAVNS